MPFQILVITEAIVPTLQEIILATVPTLDTKETTVKRVWQINTHYYNSNLIWRTVSRRVD